MPKTILEEVVKLKAPWHKRASEVIYKDPTAPGARLVWQQKAVLLRNRNLVRSTGAAVCTVRPCDYLSHAAFAGLNQRAMFTHNASLFQQNNG